MPRKRREERHEGQEEAERQIIHPNAEAALRAAKRACRGREGRWFGRAASCEAGGTVFLVYKDGKVIERHVACR